MHRSSKFLDFIWTFIKGIAQQNYVKSLNLDKDRTEAILNTLMCFEAHTKIPDIPDDTPLGGYYHKNKLNNAFYW